MILPPEHGMRPGESVDDYLDRLVAAAPPLTAAARDIIRSAFRAPRPRTDQVRTPAA